MMLGMAMWVSPPLWLTQITLNNFGWIDIKLCADIHGRHDFGDLLTLHNEVDNCGFGWDVLKQYWLVPTFGRHFMLFRTNCINDLLTFHIASSSGQNRN